LLLENKITAPLGIAEDSLYFSAGSTRIALVFSLTAELSNLKGSLIICVSQFQEDSFAVDCGR
jgi:hypothetical protein